MSRPQLFQPPGPKISQAFAACSPMTKTYSDDWSWTLATAVLQSRKSAGNVHKLELELLAILILICAPMTFNPLPVLQNVLLVFTILINVSFSPIVRNFH